MAKTTMRVEPPECSGHKKDDVPDRGSVRYVQRAAKHHLGEGPMCLVVHTATGARALLLYAH